MQESTPLGSTSEPAHYAKAAGRGARAGGPRVLYGVVHDPSCQGGVNTCNKRTLRGLEGRVDLCLLVGKRPEGETRPQGVAIGTFQGHPAMFVWKDRRTIYRFTFPGDNAVIDEFIDELARALVTLGVDVLHVSDWEDPVGVSLFYAALKAGVPWVLTLVDYRLVCAECALFEQGLRLCEGPDAEFRKCSRCLATHRPPFAGRLTGLLNLSRDVRYHLGLRPLLRYYASPQEYRRRHEMLGQLFRQASGLITWSQFHADLVSQRLELPRSLFRVIRYCMEEPSPGYAPSEVRFHAPMKFGWVNNISPQWGVRFLIRAWRAADIPPERARLHLFIYPGHGKAVLPLCRDLVAQKRVVIEEVRVLGREEELLRHLALWITVPLWHTNAWGPDSFGYGIPLVFPDGGPMEDWVMQGKSFQFHHGDLSSLASLLRELAFHPELVEEAAAQCKYLPEYGHDHFGEQHVALYRELLSQNEV